MIELKTGNEILSLPGGGHFYPSGIAFSPDARLVAWGCGDQIQIVDIGTGKVKATAGGHAHLPTNSILAFSPDGKLLATGGDDKLVLIHDAATGKEVRRFEGHQGAITSLGWSPDGARLASGSADTTILIWTLEAPSKK